jgi:hypothetical protein
LEEVDHAVAFTNEHLVAQCGHLEQVEVTDLQQIEGSKGDVDVVVAWVDGRDPEHRAKRKRYLAHPGGHARPERAAREERRFSDNDEIRYCALDPQLRALGPHDLARDG